MLVVFLFLLLFYQIAWEEEQPHCWKSIQAYPKSYRRNYIGKLLALLLFQIPVAGIGILFYYSLESTVSIAFYVIYYAFNVYISLVFSIPVLRHQKVIFLPWGQLLFFNITKRMTPLFLLFCIFNEKQWTNFFYLLAVCPMFLYPCANWIMYCVALLYEKKVISRNGFK